MDTIPHAVHHSLTLLKMDEKLPETCWADLEINKLLFFSSSWSSILFTYIDDAQSNTNQISIGDMGSVVNKKCQHCCWRVRMNCRQVIICWPLNYFSLQYWTSFSGGSACLFTAFLINVEYKFSTERALCCVEKFAVVSRVNMKMHYR